MLGKVPGGQRPQVAAQYPPAGAPATNMKASPHLPKPCCCWQLYWLSGAISTQMPLGDVCPGDGTAALLGAGVTVGDAVAGGVVVAVAAGVSVAAGAVVATGLGDASTVRTGVAAGVPGAEGSVRSQV